MRNMPENPKLPQSASPVARAGAGDISERELSRERSNLYSTPQTRMPRSHPRKQLFSSPVNKFTAKTPIPSSNLARIRSCLEDYRTKSCRPPKIGTKAASMEDLTPSKRKVDRKGMELSVVRSPYPSNSKEQQAAAKIGRFMLMTAWRRRRDEIRCLRKTLEFQVSCSERLRIQVAALKSLLDSDNMKVRLAMRELERLKQLLREKDLEKAVLEREKIALEEDVCAAEDRMSEMRIGWRNTRNELESALAARGSAEQALALERAALTELRHQRDHAYRRISELEEDLAQHESLLSSAEQEVSELRQEAAENRRELESTSEELHLEREARERCSAECSALSVRVALAAQESVALSGELSELRAQLARLERELALTREQLDWWPRPLTKMLGVARYWIRHPMSLPEALLWSMIPAAGRHG
ncbi:unnamed protein product [Leptidea sinapis]|uniref:Uncharacterized protein n=2 Tax=Leptidea sinapis TaxID=189913 RepID=A0A5E4R1J4_9NEOP|nr:unnamed protein product [Leptidea sinapis]